MAKVKSVVGLDIGSKSVKAVELTPVGSGYVVTGYASRELAGPDESALKETLKEMFSGNHFKTKKVVTSVSGRSVIVRYIAMPEMANDELKNAIKYEASKYIPFEVEEVVIDCQRLEAGQKSAEKDKAPAKEMRVLLVAAKRAMIDKHVGLLEDSGLWPLVIDVDSFALGNALELHRTLSSEPIPADKTIALIDIGASKTNINIIQDNISYFTREIYIAGNDFTDAITKKLGCEPIEAEKIKRAPENRSDEVKEVVSSMLEDLCHEIHLSLDYFENQFDKSVDYLYLSGGGALLIGLDEVFEKTFDKRPVRWNPFEHLNIDTTQVNQDDIRKQFSQLTIAVGLAARIGG
ncbi:MAG: type IV pilus assembly protein PilM [Planctomycetota bacterium]